MPQSNSGAGSFIEDTVRIYDVEEVTAEAVAEGRSMSSPPPEFNEGKPTHQYPCVHAWLSTSLICAILLSRAHHLYFLVRAAFVYDYYSLTTDEVELPPECPV